MLKMDRLIQYQYHGMREHRTWDNYFLYLNNAIKNMVEKVKKIQEITDEDWKSRLSPEQYEVC
ncbi:MAG: hypothetical protein QN721_09495, partial [Nitrososphaeraceae archaeon]|nr:hypothetical protein [Nitrososphaeraceae archaeon]